MVKNTSKGIFLLELNSKKCNQCEVCFNVCPGHSVNFGSLNLKIFGKKPEDALIGNYINCYTGHATDHEIKYNSTSGGIITALFSP